MNTTTKKARALWIAINLVCATVASGSTANQLRPDFTSHLAPVAHQVAKPVLDASPVQVQEAAPSPSVRLRRIGGSEMSPALVKMAGKIIREHHKEPFGTDIAFEINGKSYVGRIERHYHPPGGELTPWGYHPGCSLFVVEPAS